MLEFRKLPRRSESLYDRCNKSDAEDRSLSNDETPLPNCPRQPPDGVETPSDAVEKATAPEPPNRLPPRLPAPAGWATTRTRFSYLSRTQDARSEASVKDKIAMFSNDRATSSERLDKCGTLPTKNSNTRKSTAAYMTNYSEIASLDRRLTKSQDNLDEAPRPYKRHTDRPEALGSIEPDSSRTYGGMPKDNSFQSESKPLFYGSTTTLPAKLDTTFVQSTYHVRSVSDDSNNKNQHKSNLEYLIEQRKKSMSKLKGLVIPETQGPIIDLPEIKVKDPLVKSFFSDVKIEKKITNKENKISHCKPITLMENKWKSNLFTSNIPKYSPAFKRKSLQVYTPSLSKETTPERKFSEKNDLCNKKLTNASILRKNLLDCKSGTDTSISSTLPAKFTAPYVSHDYKGVMNNIRDYKNVEIKICTATDIVDSDNDSAMSSTQSSYRSSASSPLHNLDTVESDSSRVSPRILSHYATYSVVKTEIPSKLSITGKSCDEFVKRGVCRSMSSDTNVSLSSSAGSAATSGSQASCSSLESSVADSDKKKVSKSYNIDTINRRNVLASAKCRSGRDAKVKSPVIETKFSHESNDDSSLSPPLPKSSDRLSTLTASVSAISNKGETRRRNKVLAETDSDSDSEVNLRQRKSDFKNTRLKRNSSASNKNKQNENSSGSPKSEDPPRVITEKIMKEIKKAGLDNYINNKKTHVQEKKTTDIIKKIDSTVKAKEAVNIKNDDVKKESAVPKQKQIDIVDNANLNKFNTTDEKKTKNVLKVDDTALRGEIAASIQIIRFRRGVGTGVGLILAGGIDCEAKDVTVHRVLEDSIAAKAGLKRGSKVRSINGHSMAGLTHAQSVTILKEQCSEVVIEIGDETHENEGAVSCGSENMDSMKPGASDTCESCDDKAGGSLVTVVLEKAGGGAGLGFGLDGGRDSPLGDRPLTIKKLFAGGAAAQSRRVLVGAELISAGGQSLEGFTRTQAWAALKALPVGPVALVLRNPTNSP